MLYNESASSKQDVVVDPISLRRTNTQTPAREWVRQSQGSGMEPQRANGIQPIDRITQDWMTQLRQMGSELVGSSGDWTHP